jgi:aspartyl-tRNA(Asn)/glutamyl-tRNA(Gln) amidotransferase subunit A
MSEQFASLVDIAADIASGRVSAVEVLEQHLARIDQREGDVHAFNLVTRDQALASAKRSTTRRSAEKSSDDSPVFRSR